MSVLTAALSLSCCYELAKESLMNLSMPFFVNFRLLKVTLKINGELEEMISISHVSLVAVYDGGGVVLMLHVKPDMY
jgi:hypothetical protein